VRTRARDVPVAFHPLTVFRRRERRHVAASCFRRRRRRTGECLARAVIPVVVSRWREPAPVMFQTVSFCRRLPPSSAASAYGRRRSRAGSSAASELQNTRSTTASARGVPAVAVTFRISVPVDCCVARTAAFLNALFLFCVL
jgi:hypothetical protein